MLALRRAFYEKHNNLLGLLYACDSDTRVSLGVPWPNPGGGISIHLPETDQNRDHADVSKL